MWRVVAEHEGHEIEALFLSSGYLMGYRVKGWNDVYFDTIEEAKADIDFVLDRR